MCGAGSLHLRPGSCRWDYLNLNRAARQPSVEEHCSWLRCGSRGRAASFSSGDSTRVGHGKERKKGERKRRRWRGKRETHTRGTETEGERERGGGRRQAGLTRGTHKLAARCTRVATHRQHKRAPTVQVQLCGSGAFIGLLRPSLRASSKGARRCLWLGENERHLKQPEPPPVLSRTQATWFSSLASLPMGFPRIAWEKWIHDEE